MRCLFCITTRTHIVPSHGLVGLLALLLSLSPYKLFGASLDSRLFLRDKINKPQCLFTLAALLLYMFEFAFRASSFTPAHLLMLSASRAAAAALLPPLPPPLNAASAEQAGVRSEAYVQEPLNRYHSVTPIALFRKLIGQTIYQAVI